MPRPPTPITGSSRCGLRPKRTTTLVASSITLAPVMTSPATAGALGLRSTARLGLAPSTPLVLALPTDPSNVLIHRAFTARVSLALGSPLGLASSADPRDLRRLNCSSLALGCHLYCSVLSVFPRSEWFRFCHLKSAAFSFADQANSQSPVASHFAMTLSESLLLSRLRSFRLSSFNLCTSSGRLIPVSFSIR